MKFNAISSLADRPFFYRQRKLLIATKFIAVLIFALVMHVNALPIRAQITLNKHNAKITDVLLEIRKQAGVDFFYDTESIESVGLVSIVVKNASLEQTLDLLVRGKSISYKINNGIVTLSPKQRENMAPILSYKRQLLVKGTVSDEQGEGLSNVNVEVISKDQGFASFQTDRHGAYRIFVGSLLDTLKFSMIGYETRIEPIGTRTEVNVTMKLSQEMLENVVVTGVYTRKAESYTGSVQTITKDELKRVGSVNVFQALKNISSSMVLDNFDMGSNPNNMPQIQVRGTSTFPADLPATGLKGNFLKNPNEPLFIVDGFEAPIERVFDLDINRIETVTILKDAASKALYGSRAANGVIVIETTKIPSDKPLVTYTTSLDVELPDLTSYNLTNSAEKLEAELLDGFYDAWPNGSSSVEADLELKQLYNYRKKLSMEGLDTYWLAKPLRDGIGQRHALSVELGGRDLRVITDVGYRNTKGVMIGSNRQNITGGLNVSYRLNNLLFRNITNVISNSTNESPYGEFSEYSRMNPYWRAVNPDGSIPYYAEQGPNGRNYTNPLFNSTLNSKNSTEYLNFINNFYLEWTMLPGLKAVTRVGIDVKRSGADEFYPAAHTRFESYRFEDLPKRRGSYQINDGSSQNISGDLNVNYSKEINKHSVFANAGFNVSERNYEELLYQVEGFPSEQMNDITFGRQYVLNTRPSGVNGVVRDMGFLGAASYMWDTRFMTDLTLRANASSQFGADRRWALFYSLGLGWNLHNEPFLKNLSWLEQFKLRGSVGSTGNQNFNTNASIATYEYILDRFYQGFPGVVLNNMVNPGLQWESKLDYNVGFDSKIAGLSLRFDYYESYTENLLTDITIPTSTGFNSVKDNLGRVKNSGFEVFGSYLLWSKGRNFVSINAGLETNKNRIVELSNSMKAYNDRMNEQAAATDNNRPVLKYQDGMSMNAIWAVPSLGIDPANGREIFVDRNGNTTYNWNASDMIVAGNSNPSYWGVFGISGEYKRIGVSITGRFLGGGQYYNQTLVDRIENIDMNYNVDRRVLTGRWQYPGQHAEYRALGFRNYTWNAGHDEEMTRPSTRFVQNRRDLTIAALNVYYDFNPSLITNLRMQRLRLAFNMNELGQFSTIGLERGLSYPFSRTFQFSLMATF